MGTGNKWVILFNESRSLLKSVINEELTATFPFSQTEVLVSSNQSHTRSCTYCKTKIMEKYNFYLFNPYITKYGIYIYLYIRPYFSMFNNTNLNYLALILGLFFCEHLAEGYNPHSACFE